MSSVERELLELVVGSIKWDRDDPTSVEVMRRVNAALREQPEARGVVDAEKLARLISEWELHDRTFGHDGRHPLIADFRAILTAAQQPGQEGGGDE